MVHVLGFFMRNLSSIYMPPSAHDSNFIAMLSRAYRVMLPEFLIRSARYASHTAEEW